MNAEQMQQFNERPLSPYEKNRATEILVRDGVPDGWITREMMLDVLRHLGLRKAETTK